MQYFRRVGLFLLVNFAILIMVSISTNLFMNYTPWGQQMADQIGYYYGNLLIWCVLLGFGGSILYLMLSKFLAKKMMGVRLIDGRDSRYGNVYNMVQELSRRAGIKMPEVGVYPEAHLNAFATGATKNNSLVAVSAGLVERMNDRELKAVIAHEISHIANGDMVTLTLLQGVLNTFVLFASRVLARRIAGGENNNGNFFAYIGVIILLEIVFGLIATIIVSAFSRYREYRADAGGANLTNNEDMMAALEVLRKDFSSLSRDKSEEKMAAFQISSKGKLLSLLSTHPPLEKRIERLKR